MPITCNLFHSYQDSKTYLDASIIFIFASKLSIRYTLLVCLQKHKHIKKTEYKSNDQDNTEKVSLYKGLMHIELIIFMRNLNKLEKQK